MTGRNCMPGHEGFGAQLGRPTKAAKRAAMAAMTPVARGRARARIERDCSRQVTNALNVLKGAGRVLSILRAGFDHDPRCAQLEDI